MPFDICDVVTRPCTDSAPAYSGYVLSIVIDAADGAITPDAARGRRPCTA